MSDKPVSDAEIVNLRYCIDEHTSLPRVPHSNIMKAFDRLVGELRKAREKKASPLSAGTPS